MPESDVMCLLCGALGTGITPCGHSVDAMTPFPNSKQDANGEPLSHDVQPGGEHG